MKLDFRTALKRFRPSDFTEHLDAAEQERREILHHFPIGDRSSMQLEENALGQERPKEDTLS